MTVFDYSKLRGRMVEKGFSQDNLAGRIGLIGVSLCRKLNNKSYFSQLQIADICGILSIEDKDIAAYFFTQRVKEL